MDIPIDKLMTPIRVNPMDLRILRNPVFKKLEMSMKDLSRIGEEEVYVALFF